MDELTFDVSNCARCCQDHDKMLFKRFLGVPFEEDGYIYNYWGLCPTLGEPVILRLEIDLSE